MSSTQVQTARAEAESSLAQSARLFDCLMSSCHHVIHSPVCPQVLFDKLNETQQQRPKTRVRPSLLFLALWPVCTLQPSPGTSRACQSKACRTAKDGILQRTQRTMNWCFAITVIVFFWIAMMHLKKFNRFLRIAAELRASLESARQASDAEAGLGVESVGGR